MPLHVTATPPRSEARTHGPTGVTVTLRRLPHLERLKVIAEASVPNADGQSASLLVGLILKRLLQPSVGVVKWDGVTGPDGNEPAYSLAALDAVAHQVPAFAGWLNDQVLAFNRIATDPDEPAPAGGSPTGEDDAAGKSPPADAG